MADRSGDRIRNPFSPMAIARIDQSDNAATTVVTLPIREAGARLSAYLAHDVELPPAGVVLAVLGDYGTGKTHLANHLLRQARQELGPDRAIYLDVTAGDMAGLHRRLLDNLGLDAVRAEVTDHYADVVADELRSRGFGDDVCAWLSTGELAPEEAVERLGLMRSALLREVEARLRRITGHADIAGALTLLLRPGFETAVWEWLGGGPAANVLRDRGLDAGVDSDLAALEAMGALLLLKTAKRRRFVLVLDEADRLAGEPGADTPSAVRRLMETSARAGVFLALVGLDDLRIAVGASVWTRVSHTVAMVGLTVNEVRSLIMLAQREMHGREELWPFMPDAVDQLTEITAGTARGVVRLCHESFRQVSEEWANGVPAAVITSEVISAVAERVFGVFSVDATSAIGRVLDANGWAYFREHPLGSARADFWVPFPDRTSGCAVVVTDSVVTGDDAASLVRRVFTVREAAPDAQVVVVVAGVLNRLYAAQLRESLGTAPLIYLDRRFTENLAALVRAATARLPHAGTEQGQQQITRRLDQINQQQSSLFGLVTQVADQVDSTRVSADARLAAVQEGLVKLTEMVSGIAEPARTTSSDLPQEVDLLFAEVMSAVSDLTQVDRLVAGIYTRPPSTRPDSLSRRLRSREFIGKVGLAHILEQAVLGFRTAVAEWYGTLPSADAALDDLDDLVDDYDETIELLPIPQVLRLMPNFTQDGDAVLNAVNDLGRHVRQAIRIELAQHPE